MTRPRNDWMVGLALVSVGCSSWTPRPSWPVWVRPPEVSAETRTIELTMWEGSCWGSSSASHSVYVGDDLVVTRSDGGVRVLHRAAWDELRGRLNALLSRTRPRTIVGGTAHPFDHCKAGANFDCGFTLRLDDRPPLDACCHEASFALGELVRSL